MNEVKRSLQAAAGDVSGQKEELKRSIRHPKQQPKRKNWFPTGASLVVMTAILLFTFNVYQNEQSNENNFEVNETLYQVHVKTEHKSNEYKDEGTLRYAVFSRMLYAESVIDHAKSLGYVENMEQINEIIREVQKTHYEDMTAEQKKMLDDQQLENFGITYEQYFNEIYKETTRLTFAEEWMKENGKDNKETYRGAMNTFINKHEAVISKFMDKHEIPDKEKTFSEAEFEGTVAAIEDNQVLVVLDDMTEEEMAGSSTEKIMNRAYDFAWFTINDAENITPYTHIKVLFDPLSNKIVLQDHKQPSYEKVFEWREL